MMISIEEMNTVLIANGIEPPKENSRRTRCPECSDFRVKKNEKCLSVRVDSDLGVVRWKCFHCDNESSDIYLGENR